jgi:hypothetical protein
MFKRFFVFIALTFTACSGFLTTEFPTKRIDWHNFDKLTITGNVQNLGNRLSVRSKGSCIDIKVPDGFNIAFVSAELTNDNFNGPNEPETPKIGVYIDGVFVRQVRVFVDENYPLDIQNFRDGSILSLRLENSADGVAFGFKSILFTETKD